MSNHAASPYHIDALELGPMENFIYLIGDRSSKRAAVVDPAWDVPAILQRAADLEVSITDILLTHSHHDHINGIETLLQHHDAQVHLLKAEAQFWGKALIRPSLHHGGDRIRLGDTTITILHTPGHTPGSACFHLGDDLITGDTMFVYGCGRCDLRGGDPQQMFTTLGRLKQELPAQTCIHPGHNYSITPTSTLNDEINGNPFLHFEHAADFIDYRMHRHDLIRRYPMQPIRKEQVSSG